jgi:hypothetical protein
MESDPMDVRPYELADLRGSIIVWGSKIEFEAVTRIFAPIWVRVIVMRCCGIR